jgi:hypothetical protein
MQRQYWRWLWIWVGVLVAGCGQVWSSDGTPSPTRGPTQPLFGYTLLPLSPTPGVRPIHTPTPLVTVDNNGSVLLSPVALIVSGPACYETPVASLICLGQVRNMLDVPVEQVVIAVLLLDRDGIPLAAEEAVLARSILPAKLAGPYRVLFEQIPAGYAGVYASVQSAKIAQDAGRDDADLTLESMTGEFAADQYQVTLTVHNNSLASAVQVSITVVLLDANAQVTGFRRVDLEVPLEAGSSQEMTINVIPQGPNTVTFSAFAEGRLSPD